MIRDAWKTIHYALHSDQEVVTIGKIDYPIHKAGNGCRYVDFEGVRIMQQNKYKSSLWAQRAAAGEKISWAMTTPSWTLIDEAAINPPSQRKEEGVKIDKNDSSTTTGVSPKSSAGSKNGRPGMHDNRPPRNFWK